MLNVVDPMIISYDRGWSTKLNNEWNEFSFGLNWMNYVNIHRLTISMVGIRYLILLSSQHCFAVDIIFIFFFRLTRKHCNGVNNVVACWWCTICEI